MEQKRYNINEKLEIISELLKGDAHVRGLARRLGISHMTVFRRISELSDENVVDYRKEGKNNVYFLKRTAEARASVMAAEGYLMTKTIQIYPQLRRVIDAIQRDKRIEMAILFGSYSKGAAKKGSDIDIYIETDDRKLKKDLELIDSRVNVKIGKYDTSSLLIKEIERNHIIIKGIERYYEKNRFFG